MRIALVLSFLLCLFNGLIFAQVGSVEGFISDNDNHQSLSGANIQIDSLSQGGISDTNGCFFIQKVPGGIYWPKVSCIGYKTQKQQIN